MNKEVILRDEDLVGWQKNWLDPSYEIKSWPEERALQLFNVGLVMALDGQKLDEAASKKQSLVWRMDDENKMAFAYSAIYFNPREPSDLKRIIVGFHRIDDYEVSVEGVFRDPSAINTLKDNDWTANVDAIWDSWQKHFGD